MLRETRLAYRFAVRELRGGLRGFYIFLACLALGVAAIAGVQSLSQGLSDSLRHDGRYILGGDLSLRTVYHPATDEQLAWLRDNFGVVGTVIEVRAMTRADDDGAATLSELKAVDAQYPLYGEPRFVDAGGAPVDLDVQDVLAANADGLPGAVAEPHLFERIDAQIGDVIHVGDQPFELRAVVDYEPDRLGSLRFSMAPRVMISSVFFQNTGLARTGSQVYYDHRVTLPDARGMEDLKRAQSRLNRAFPDASWRVRDFTNASSRLERFIDRLGLYLTLIGLTALLIGGVGIGNAVRSHLDSRLGVIATFKCLGAPSSLVFRTWLWQIAMLAGLGIAIGLVLGAAVPYLAGGALARELALTDKVGIYPAKLALAALFGALVTLAFSLWPLGRACRIAAADLFRDVIAPKLGRPSWKVILSAGLALAALALTVVLSASDRRLALWFLAGAAASVVVFLLIAVAIRFVLRRLPRPRGAELRLALANLYRPGNVTASVILSLGLGLTVLVIIALIQRNFSENIAKAAAEDAPAFFFLDIQDDQLEEFLKIAKATPDVGKVKTTPILRGRIAALNGVPAEDALVDEGESWLIRGDRGFTYMTEQPEYGEIIAGEWWPPGYDGPPIVSVAEDVQQGFDVGVGDTITVNILGVDMAATIANIRAIDWGTFTMNFAVTFAPGSLEDAPASHIATVELPPERELELQRNLAAAMPNVTAIRVREMLATAADLLDTIATAVKAAASVTLLAGTFVLAGAVAAGRRRRIYDAVILKVLGVTKKRVLRVFLAEYGLLGVVTALAAAGMGTLLAYLVQTEIIDLPWHFDALTVALTVVVCAVITIMFGYAGTWRAMRAKAAPILRNR